jgi:hypothetical protein
VGGKREKIIDENDENNLIAWSIPVIRNCLVYFLPNFLHIIKRFKKKLCKINEIVKYGFCILNNEKGDYVRP